LPQTLQNVSRNWSSCLTFVTSTDKQHSAQ